MRALFVIMAALALAACDPLPVAQADPAPAAALWPQVAEGAVQGQVFEYY